MFENENYYKTIPFKHSDPTCKLNVDLDKLLNKVTKNDLSIEKIPKMDVLL